MACSLCLIGYGLGLVLLGILIIIGIQVISLLCKVNTIVKRIDSLTDVQTWLHVFKTFFSRKKST